MSQSSTQCPWSLNASLATKLLEDYDKLTRTMLPSNGINNGSLRRRVRSLPCELFPNVEASHHKPYNVLRDFINPYTLCGALHLATLLFELQFRRPVPWLVLTVWRGPLSCQHQAAMKPKMRMV